MDARNVFDAIIERFFSLKELYIISRKFKFQSCKFLLFIHVCLKYIYCYIHYFMCLGAALQRMVPKDKLSFNPLFQSEIISLRNEEGLPVGTFQRSSSHNSRPSAPSRPVSR